MRRGRLRYGSAQQDPRAARFESLDLDLARSGGEALERRLWANEREDRRAAFAPRSNWIFRIDSTNHADTALLMEASP